MKLPNPDLAVVDIVKLAGMREAVAAGEDRYGVRYLVDFPVMRAGRRAMVRSAWIVRAGETFPRLTSCYVL